MRGWGRLQRGIRYLSAPFRSSAVILLYHRVYDTALDPQLLCVRPEYFREHLDYLTKRYCVLSLTQLLITLNSSTTLPRRAVVITFDDGYADNLLYAKPFLEQFDTPATVFSTTRFSGSDQEFYWDELERILLHPGRLPQIPPDVINNIMSAMPFALDTSYSMRNLSMVIDWNETSCNDRNRREALYSLLCEQLRPLPHRGRATVLEQLHSLLGIEGSNRSTHRMLSLEEIVKLADGGLVEIGGHTVSHSWLAKLTAQEQFSEIMNNKAVLENIIGHHVTSFSYPFGTKSSYSETTLRILRDGGFTCACSNFCARLSRFTNQFELPRCLVRDWDGDEFGRRLETWFRV
jgi:peptidoglycan/xylan/chitin deacetylase (PgdA/CDA1 family)